jgi:toxin FitB
LILADANVLSETSKQHRDPNVLAWIGANWPELYLPTPVLAELRYGCAKLPESAKRRELEKWLADLTIQFDDRIVPFDQKAAEAHGTLRAKLKAIGKPCPPSDSYVAAMGLSFDCPIATRDVADFAWTGVKLINPWEA